MRKYCIFCFHSLADISLYCFSNFFVFLLKNYSHLCFKKQLFLCNLFLYSLRQKYKLFFTYTLIFSYLCPQSFFYHQTMNIKLILMGKTDSSLLQSLMDIYTKRLSQYISFSTVVLPDIKNSKSLTFEQQKTKQGELILGELSPLDFVVLLDEKGSEFTSVEFSTYLQKKMNASVSSLVFVIGGAYGFSPSLYLRANYKLSLSKMTFSHQMVRLFFVEQLYRAFTIINHQPYHHN